MSSSYRRLRYESRRPGPLHVGPPLGEYGVNRYNVAISRARDRLFLVTSFTADQLPESGSRQRRDQRARHSTGFPAPRGEHRRTAERSAAGLRQDDQSTPLMTRSRSFRPIVTPAMDVCAAYILGPGGLPALTSRRAIHQAKTLAQRTDGMLHGPQSGTAGRRCVCSHRA